MEADALLSVYIIGPSTVSNLDKLDFLKSRIRQPSIDIFIENLHSPQLTNSNSTDQLQLVIEDVVNAAGELRLVLTSGNDQKL